MDFYTSYDVKASFLLDFTQSYDMQCFPLYSLILATGNRTVNYLRCSLIVVKHLRSLLITVNHLLSGLIIV